MTENKKKKKELFETGVDLTKIIMPVGEAIAALYYKKVPKSELMVEYLCKCTGKVIVNYLEFEKKHGDAFLHCGHCQKTQQKKDLGKGNILQLVQNA